MNKHTQFFLDEPKTFVQSSHSGRSTILLDASPKHHKSEVSLDLRDQIQAAFQKAPNVARIFHGERRIRQGGRGRRTALFPSCKCQGSVPLESQLELAHAIVLERSPDVKDYRTQAIRIALPCSRFSYPDFLVRSTTGSLEVHEIKPSIDDLSATDVQRFTIVKSLLQEAGVGFRVIDAHSLPSRREVESILFQYARGHLQVFSKQQIDLAKALLVGRSNSTLSDAYQILEQHDLPPQIADFLSFHRQEPFTDHQDTEPVGSGGAL